MKIRYERVTVTPKLAAEWLEKNDPSNRRPKNSRIPMYARDMLTGRWNSDTGETIKFDSFGTLIDGQNRLRAVVLAGETDPNMTVDLDVSRGHPPEVMQVIDSGAARTFADSMAVLGVIDRNRVGAIVRWACQWDIGNPMATGKFSPTNAELWDRYRREANLFDAATKRGADCSRQGLGLSSSASMAYYLFAKLDPSRGSDADTFFDHYVSGAGLDFGDPILALRNRMARVKLDRLRRQEQLALTIKAWNSWRDGKRVDSIILPKGALTAANFPMPK